MNVESALLNVAVFWGLVTPHEYAHAWVAAKLGDETPRRDGRLTLNPLAHADWLGTVLLPLFTSLGGYGFLGWGRPVRTNAGALRGGLRGLALVSLAGPTGNLLLAIALGAVAAVAARSAPTLFYLLERAVWLSVYLALFNLLPVPPLDGSKLLVLLRLPPVVYEQAERFGLLILFGAVIALDLVRWLSLASWTGARLILGWFV